jgi:hypothetical protein
MDRSASTPAIPTQWPSGSQTDSLGIREAIQALLHRAVLMHIVRGIASIAAYIAVLNAPAILSPLPMDTLQQELWWPLKLLFLFGTGGAISRPGFASVGLLGGLIHLRHVHARVRLGVPAWDAIKTPVNLVLTMLITLFMVSLYKVYAPNTDLVSLSFLYASAFLGSMLCQFLNAYFYRRTGASLIYVNILLTFRLFLMHSGLSNPAQWFILSVAMACTCAMLMKLVFPQMVPLEMGEPPRQPVLVPLPAVDTKWGVALSLTILIGAAIGDALFDLVIPPATVLSKWIVFTLSVIFLTAVAELFFRLNNRVGLWSTINPIFFAKRMSRIFWTVRHVAPGSPTARFLHLIVNRAQRLTMVMLSIAIIVPGLYAAGFRELNQNTALLLMMIPLLIVSTTQFVQAIATHTSNS